MKPTSRHALKIAGISLLLAGLVPSAAVATTKPSAVTIEKAMLKALQSSSSIQFQFISKQAGQTMSGVQWSSPTQALQSTNYLGQTNHIMMIGDKLWVNDNATGLRAMFNASSAQANRWQNLWIAVPKTNSNYKYIVNGLKGASLFSSFLPKGKVRVVGPAHSKNGDVFTLFGETAKSGGTGGFPMGVVVSATAPYLPIGTYISATLNGKKYTSTLKVAGFNTKAPVVISVPNSALAYALTGMPK